jgi:hypothetical protein
VVSVNDYQRFHSQSVLKEGQCVTNVNPRDLNLDAGAADQV